MQAVHAKSIGKSNPMDIFEAIVDKYESVEEVQDALLAAELESSEVIVAVDFTASNEDSGKESFAGARISVSRCPSFSPVD